MTKFEEELFYKVPCKFELPTEAEYKKTTLINHFKNWHSDDEYQELFDKYSNLNDNYEKEVIRSSKLESQITGLKSQLQQQALPVVPECVDMTIKQIKNDQLSMYGALNAILSDVNTEIYAWISKGNQNAFARAWLDGYTVEKPQLFYLRDELTGQFLAKDNQFKDKDRYFFWTGEDPLTHSIGTAWKLSFTQQEIDSMQTGSYELVPVEDGE